MPGHQCHHCKQWVEPGDAHDCWTTTEAALTDDLSEDLREAWERLRETAVGFGEQRIYASHHCIMFSRQACYFFVRPKRQVLEVVFFLGHALQAPQVRRVKPSSRVKLAHVVHIRHRDEVEPPITDWLRDAFESSDALSGTAGRRSSTRASKTGRQKPAVRARMATAGHERAAKATGSRATPRSGLLRERRPRRRR